MVVVSIQEMFIQVFNLIIWSLLLCCSSSLFWIPTSCLSPLSISDFPDSWGFAGTSLGISRWRSNDCKRRCERKLFSLCTANGLLYPWHPGKVTSHNSLGPACFSQVTTSNPVCEQLSLRRISTRARHFAHGTRRVTFLWHAVISQDLKRNFRREL